MIRDMMSPCMITAIFLLIVLYFTYEPQNLSFLGGAEHENNEDEETQDQHADKSSDEESHDDGAPPVGPPTLEPYQNNLNNMYNNPEPDAEPDAEDNYDDLPNDLNNFDFIFFNSIFNLFGLFCFLYRWILTGYVAF